MLRITLHRGFSTGPHVKKGLQYTFLVLVFPRFKRAVQLTGDLQDSEREAFLPSSLNLRSADNLKALYYLKKRYDANITYSSGALIGLSPLLFLGFTLLGSWE